MSVLSHGEKIAEWVKADTEVLGYGLVGPRRRQYTLTHHWGLYGHYTGSFATLIFSGTKLDPPTQFPTRRQAQRSFQRRSGRAGQNDRLLTGYLGHLSG